MAAPSVDTRKLKDSVAEYLRKSKFEKASETLEQLIKLEPRDMTHRLKLGDTYRRTDHIAKAITCYQVAVKHFSDEGQLIKAIGAVKVILEVDPKNEMAQRELAEMNNRRFAKPTLESAGLKPRATGAGPRGSSTLELVEEPRAASPGGHFFGDGTPDPQLDHGGDDEPLELDDGRPSPARRKNPAPAPKRPLAAERGSGPPPNKRPTFDLGSATDELAPVGEPVPVAAVEANLDEASLPELPAEAIIDIEAAAKAASGVELELDDGRPHPIADLVGSGAEEEIELISISSDSALSAPPVLTPQVAVTSADLDAAFAAISPAARAEPPRPPPRVPLFDDLPQAAFVELVNKLNYRRYSPPELILREGEPGRSFFVIVEGRVRVFKAQPGGVELTLAHLQAGAFFGEMALLSGAPRTANVAAEEDTELLEITDQVLRDVVGKFPQVGAALKGFYRQRLLNNVMAISPLFIDFDPAERKAIVQRFRMRQAAGGEVLIAEGKPSDGLYVVLHGAVSVEVKAGPGGGAADSSGRAMPVARLKEGDLFGEMSLLTRKPATATVTALGNCILLKLPRENFQELMLTHPQILELISTLTEQRQSATEAILHGHGPGIDGMAFV